MDDSAERDSDTEARSVAKRDAREQLPVLRLARK
jgi:hypothetical protein